MRPDDTSYHRTGFGAILSKGTQVRAGEPIAFVLAVDDNSALKAGQDYLACVEIS